MGNTDKNSQRNEVLLSKTEVHSQEKLQNRQQNIIGYYKYAKIQDNTILKSEIIFSYWSKMMDKIYFNTVPT